MSPCGSQPHGQNTADSAELLLQCYCACCAQVIEFYASGAAMEVYRERSPQELGLHPRDVTLFAPLSRLAAPQVSGIGLLDMYM